MSNAEEPPGAAHPESAAANVRALGMALHAIVGDRNEGQSQELLAASSRCLCTILRISACAQERTSLALRLTRALETLLCQCCDHHLATEATLASLAVQLEELSVAVSAQPEAYTDFHDPAPQSHPHPPPPAAAWPHASDGDRDAAERWLRQTASARENNIDRLLEQEEEAIGSALQRRREARAASRGGWGWSLAWFFAPAFPVLLSVLATMSWRPVTGAGVPEAAAPVCAAPPFPEELPSW